MKQKKDGRELGLEGVTPWQKAIDCDAMTNRSNGSKYQAMQSCIVKIKKSAALWGALFIFCVTIIPYLQTVGFGFINLDDIAYVRGCDRVRDGLTLGGIKWAFTSFEYNAIWMPLTWISYMIDVSLWGVDAGVLHIINALLHATNAVLLFYLLKQILSHTHKILYPTATEHGSRTAASKRTLIIAVIAALFWSEHPLRVEPVAWIASRKDVLSVFWELWAFIFWIKGLGTDATQSAEIKPGKQDAVEALIKPAALFIDRPQIYRCFALVCFACASMSKPTAMTFPILAGLLEFLLTRRVCWRNYAVPLLCGLGVAWLAQYSQTMGGATQTLEHVPLYGRLLNAVAAFGSYCWQTIDPSQLSASHVHKWPNPPQFVWPGLAITFVYGTVLLFLLFRSNAGRVLLAELPEPIRRKMKRDKMAAQHSSGVYDGLFVGLLWFLVAVSPMLGVMNFGYHSHADRFTYLPSVGFSLAVAMTLANFEDKVVRVISTVLFVLYVSWFGKTWQQTSVWKNDKTLFLHALEFDPDNYAAHRNLGLYYYGTEHDLPLAVRHFQKAFQINREWNRFTQLYYILALAESGDLKGAVEETRDLSIWNENRVRKEMAASSNSEEVKSFSAIDTFIAYAMIAHYEDDDELAHKHLDYVLRMNSRNEEAHYIKGLIAYKKHRYEEAITHWRICIETTTGMPRPFLENVIAELQKRS